MGNEVDDINAGNLLLLEEEHRLAFLLAEDRYQHIGTTDLTFARALHMKDCALQYTLKTQGWLGFTIAILFWNQRGCRVDKLGQFPAQALHVGAAGAQHIHGRMVIQQGQQQVFYSHEFMALAAGFLERQIQGDLEISIEHGATSSCDLSRFITLPAESDTSADAGIPWHSH